METRSRKRAEATTRRPPPAQSSSRASKRARIASGSSSTPASGTTSTTASASRSRPSTRSHPSVGNVQEARMESAPESTSRRESRNKDKASKREHDKEFEDRGSEKVLRGGGNGGSGEAADKGKEKEQHQVQHQQQQQEQHRAAAEADDDNDGEGVSTLQQNLASASSALHGLLRKLGAGLDDFLPSSTPSAHQSSRLKRILSGLRAEGEEARQLESLSQLCEVLSIGTEESLSSFAVESFVPVLVGLLNREYNPDVMLLAARALTHLCDVLPSSCAAVVHYGAVPCFCARLLTIEYIDLAEQSLQALGKISHEHPAACLRAGALIAVLSYLDFFSTGVQRLAVSTAANMCRQLPADAVDYVMEAVPILTNLLQYHDPKVVEHASLCLTRIADAFAKSSEKIDMLCSHGLLPLAARLVSVGNPNGVLVSQTSLSPSTYTGLIRLLSSCASGSAAASESLLVLGISSILKDILIGAGFTTSTSVAPSSVSRLPEQLFEIVNLVNELLPPVPDGAMESRRARPEPSSRTTEVSAREKLLLERPEVLTQFGTDLFPVLVQVYGSSVTSSVRHKCLAAIHKLLHFSTAAMLETLSKETNISSFLAGVLTSKDPSVLLTALQIAQLLMEKLPVYFSKMFVKEGVVHAIDALVASEPTRNGDVTSSTKTRRNSHSRRRGSGNDNSAEETAPIGSPPAPEPPLQVARSSVLAAAISKAKHLKDAHFSAGLTDGGSTESLCKLKALCAKLNPENVEVKGKGKGKAKAAAAPAVSEEDFLATITELLSELSNGDGVSTFEFVNSGVVVSLLSYFSCAGIKDNSSDGKLREQALKRLQQFLDVSLPAAQQQNKAIPLTVLVRKLQNALGSLERFPVILSHGPRASGSTASIAAGLSALTQPFKLRLCKAPGEKVLRDYSSNIVLIEPLATLGAIEDFLWPRVKRHDSSPSSTGAGSSEGASPAGTPAVSTSTPPTRPSTRSRTAAAAKEAETAFPTTSKGKGKAKSTGDARLATENRGPETRAARRRAAATSSATKTVESEDEDADASPVEVEEAVAMEEDDVSDDDEDDDEVFGVEPAEVCIGDRVHDVRLGEASDQAVASATTSETPSAFSTGIGGINIGRSPAVLIPGTDGSGSRTGTSTSAGRVGSLSFAAAAMSGMTSAGNGTRAGKERKSLAAVAAVNVPPKLLFYLGGKQLHRSLTIFQAIQRQSATDEDDEERYAAPDQQSSNGRRLWDEVYTITYQRADEKPSPGASSSDGRGAGSTGPSSQGAEGSWQQASLLEGIIQGSLPCDLDKSNSTYNILLLLRVLEGLNRLAPRLRAQGTADLFANGAISSILEANTGGTQVLQEEFISSKLTPKLARQMQDALALCSGGLPAWCHQLTKACPFLFPFETRRQYFHSTAFGLSRALQRLQQQQSADGSSPANERELRVGRLQRQKVRVSRSRILDSAAKVMELYCGHKAVLEVEYFGEVGTGLGPTLEFYTLVSRELQRASLDLWRMQQQPSPGPRDVDMTEASEEGSGDEALVESTTDSEYVNAPHGLFPRPWLASSPKNAKVVEHFRLLGRVMAKALQDGRMLDLPFSVAFYKLILGQELDLYDIKTIDPELGTTLDELQALVRRKQVLESARRSVGGLRFQGSRIEDLCLDFTLPGYPELHLKEGGDQIMVTLDNLEEYIALVVDATVKQGVSAQLEALRNGFNQVFQLSSLQIFSEQELEYLLCGRRELWTTEALVDHIKFDHGYTTSSPPVRHLLEIMGEFTPQEQRDFLRFVTGAPRLPPGGLASLNPRLTIVRKHSQHPTGGNGSSNVLSSTPPGAASAAGTTLADGDLPSVMTCANYLKLPPYSSKEIMRERLMYAISEGQGSFDLS